MKIEFRTFLPVALVAIVCSLALSSVIFSDFRSKWLGADILVSDETGFSLWYLGETADLRNWEIPTKLGAIIELPLGISAIPDTTLAPIDSIEFRLAGVPEFLELQEGATFPGFHLDIVQNPGQSLMTNDISIFITPEEFSDEDDGIPGAPANDPLEDLITATDEILRISFRIAAMPTTDTEPISVAGILTARDGDFTRFYADANPDLPGNNNGTLVLDPQFAAYPHIISTRAVTDDLIELVFDTDLLAGVSNPGAENTANYEIYACKTTIPGIDPNDPNSADAENCRMITQESLADPGVPVLAELDAEDASIVRLTTDIGSSLIDGAHYIVLVKNIGNVAADEFLPAEGIFSQTFVWTSHPTIKKVVAKDYGILHVEFNGTVCAAEAPNDPTDPMNYQVIACNLDSPYTQCIEKNNGAESDLAVLDVMFDGDRIAALFTEPQQENVYYIVRAENLRDSTCAEESTIPPEVDVVSPQFLGYNSIATGGELAIALSESEQIHLPWREELHLKPTDGIAPYEWFIEPAEAGQLEVDSETGAIVFRPRLIDDNNQTAQDERDVTLTLVDAAESVSTISIHVLRRGDLGGRSPQLLDKSDIQDVNDIAAGWKR